MHLIVTALQHNLCIYDFKSNLTSIHIGTDAAMSIVSILMATHPKSDNDIHYT